MNQTLNQLLASRLGIEGDAANFQPQDIAAALASRTSNPLMAALLTQVYNRHPDTEAEEPEIDEVNYERELARLQKLIARLKKELASAELMARYIAEVFGACPRCWGLNKLCPHCEGRGQPGFSEPDYEELRTWVGPVLKKGGLDIP